MYLKQIKFILLALLSVTTVISFAGVSAAPNSVLPPNLAAAYSFDASAGISLTDISGNNQHGTLINSPIWTAGKYGNAISFDGINDYITIGDLDLPGSFTVSFWATADNLGAGCHGSAVMKRYDYGFELCDGQMLGQVGNGAGGFDVALAYTIPQTGVWNNYALTYNGVTAMLYVNGSLVATASKSHTSNNNPLMIGTWNTSSEFYDGLIDEVRIYTRVLTPSEIQTDMNTPLENGTPPDIVPPQVSITFPQDAAQVSNIINISADASDDVGVLGVQFLIDGVNVGSEDVNPPYGFSWDTRADVNGAHTLTARARDAYNTTLSTAVTVNVANANYFQNEILATGFDLPVSIEFLPDGRMLVIELTGTIKILPPPFTQPDPTPFLELNLNIGGYDGLQQGIYDIVLDPDFANNHYYYIFYTTGGQNRHDRLSRFTADASLTGTVAGSEVVLYQDPQVADTEHHGGALNFGNDGKLYFTTGEHFVPNESQSLSSPRGKIHRINKDGTVPTDNPFYDGAGPNWDSIWALGLRNPFRAYYDAPTGRLLIGDVGGNDYGIAKEELNLGIPGANYGWPNSEGNCSAPCTSPIYFYPHNGRDASITGGFIYHGSQYPSNYQGNYFFADYAQNWIRRLTFDQNGIVNGVFNFEPADGTIDGPYGDIVFLTEGPDGAIYYVDLGYSDVGGTFGISKIRRIRYVESNQAPIAQAAANPAEGPNPLSVNFSSAGSSDPEGQPLSYSWDFGDATSSTNANPVHVYTQAAQYTVRLTVSDGVNNTLAAPLFISVGIRPSATIITPQDGLTFVAGQVITFSGDGIDTEDGALPDSAFTWNIDFLHAGHVHPGALVSGARSGNFTIPSSGHDFSGDTRYRITLTVTDSDGLQDVKSILIYPSKVNLSFDTVPSGLTIMLDGIGHVTPFIYDTVVGFSHTIDAPDQASYAFVSWSDGEAQSHEITAPSQNSSYQAVFTSPTATHTPSPTITPTPGTGFPTTGILDSFNRGNGPIGSNWSGQTSGYGIVSSQLDVGTSEDIYWNGTTFGADQEAYMTLTTIDPNGSEIGLILKSQSNSSIIGMIVVVYNPVPKSVQVWTYTTAQGWQARGNVIPVTFVNGDQFGARAIANGNVEVYRNGTLLATSSVTGWPSYAGGGYIGIFPLAASNTVLDNFGGGTRVTIPTATNTPIPPTATFTHTLTPTHTPSFTPTATPNLTWTATETLQPTPTHTPTLTPTNTATFTPSPTRTNTATFTPTNTSTPVSPDVLYLSSTVDGTAGGVAFADEDILSYNKATGIWSMYFDGSDVGITSDVDAFSLMSDGSILLSLDADVAVGTLGTVDESDIIRFIPTSLGVNTSGNFQWYFDGSDVGLTTSAEDIDAIGFAPDGRLIFSTGGSVSVTGASGNDEDLLAFSPTSLGAATSGTWSLYFDGSDVGLNDASSEDVNGVWIDPVNNAIYLTTRGAFTVTGISGSGSDIFICAPVSLGATTSCTYSSYWVGSLNGFSGKIVDGLHIVR